MPPDPRPRSCQELRELDRRALAEYGLLGLVLMENAGAGAARALGAACSAWGLAPATIAVVCGGGNNGGDGAVVARHLANTGLAVEVVYALATRARTSDDGLVQRRIVERMGLVRALEDTRAARAAFLARHTLLVDALCGTGASGAPRAPVAHWIEGLNQRRAQGARTIALDLPSGLDADTGTPHAPTVEADLTLTFAAPKLGFQAAARWTGRVEVIDIGVPRALLSAP